MTEEVQVPTPLLAPSAGLPDVIDTEELFSTAIAQLAQGNGPFALDAERRKYTGGCSGLEACAFGDRSRRARGSRHDRQVPRA